MNNKYHTIFNLFQVKYINKTVIKREIGNDKNI